MGHDKNYLKAENFGP